MTDFLSGFDNAPVTQAFLTLSAIFTIFFKIQGRSSKLGLSYQDIFGKFRLWKLIVSIFSFSSTSELMFGLYLPYYFRVFERQIGSNKYSVFVFFSVIASLLFEVLSLAFLKESVASIVTSGPYGLIFSSFVSFFFDIPRCTRFNVFGMQFSDKVFIYLAGIQLLWSSGSRSIVPGLCGILAGSLYRLNVLGIRKAKIPEGILSYFSRFSWLSIEGPPSTPSSNIVGNIPPFSAHQAERNSPPVAAVVEPTEDAISTLVSMGFDRDSARQALVHARNDINMATNNLLLEGQSHSYGNNIF